MFATKPAMMLETKVLLSGLFYALGIPISILGVIANYGTWKADILFFLGGMLMAVKIIYYIVDKDQQRKKRNMELEEQRYNLNDKKQNHGNKN